MVFIVSLELGIMTATRQVGGREIRELEFNSLELSRCLLNR